MPSTEATAATAPMPPTPPPSQRERLAAAARALAAAEEAVRAPAAGATGEAADRATNPPAPADAVAAAKAWVDGEADPHEAGLGASGHLDLSSIQAGASLDEAGARQVVLRQLTMGPRTRRQLEDKLRQKGCPDEIAAQVLDRMTAVGLVDDQAYAELLVRSKQAGRGLAKRALAQELRLKGVDDELVTQALGSLDPESERARAEQLAAKKMRTMAGLEPQVQARRLSGMLASKGYQPGVIYAVVRDAVNDAPEHRRD